VGPVRLSGAPAVATGKTLGGDPDINPAAAAGAEASLCPKCQGKLIDPSGLGWCKSCGYCKSLEEEKDRVPLAETPATPRTPSVLGMVEFGQMLAKLPNWALVLISGIGVVVVANLPPAKALAENSLTRAVFATAEMGVGLLMIVAAQIWALFVLAPGDDKLGFKDAILPGRLWGMTLKRLPAMRGQVWLASWGISCILAAVLIIGGLAHWLDYLPKKANSPAAVEQPQ